MSKTKRKAKRREANLSEILDGPTEAQLANGHYVRDFVMQADNATQAMAWTNRGGTPVMRWATSGKLNVRQLTAIERCQSLWRILDSSPSVTAQYGERIQSTGSEETRATKWLAAKDEMLRIQGYVSKTAWNVYQNVCRWHMPAGVAGGELGYGSRSAEVRAHTLVCEVADRIVEEEKL